MATRLTQRSGKGVSWLAARVMKDYCKDLYKVPKSSFHPSIPQTPLAVPWHLNDTESVSAYQDEAEEEVKWGNVETFGGSSLHSLGEYMLPKPLEELDLVEKFSLLRFHHFEEVRDHFGVKKRCFPGEEAFTGGSSRIQGGKCQHFRSAPSDHHLGGRDAETKRGPGDGRTQ